MTVRELKEKRQSLNLSYRSLDPEYHQQLRDQGKPEEFIQKRIAAGNQTKKTNEQTLAQFDRAVMVYEAHNGGFPPVSHGGLDYRQAILAGAALIAPGEKVEF